MAAKLPRRLKSRRGGHDYGFAKLSQLLFGDRPAAQDLDLSVAQRHNRRFQAVRRRSGVDNQWNTAIEFLNDMRRRRRADAAKAISARRREWPPERSDDFVENGMGTKANGNSVEASRHNILNCGLSRKNKC